MNRLYKISVIFDRRPATSASPPKADSQVLMSNWSRWELRGVAREQRIGAADHERCCSQLRGLCEGRFEVGFGARVEYMKPHAECIGHGLQVFRNRCREWICGVDEQSNGRRPGEQLTRKFEPLRLDFDA